MTNLDLLESDLLDALFGTCDRIAIATEANESCDRCGEHVRATWMVRVTRDTVLTFCNAHMRAYSARQTGS